MEAGNLILFHSIFFPNLALLIQNNILLQDWSLYVYIGVPGSASKQVTEEAPRDEFGAKDLRTLVQLKVDHKSRPLWVVSLILRV